MKTAYFGKSQYSGIDITFTRSSNTIHVAGWYDSMVGIEGETITLREFFARVGITEKDCERAWRGI